jgi:hypothetical protein
VKVHIDETVLVSEEQRVQLAAVLDGTGAKKRIATRNELKDFIWTHGREWALDLADKHDDDEDLIGPTDEPDDDDLL